MIVHNPSVPCAACREAEKLGLSEEQADLFHELVSAELDVSDVMQELEDSGVDMENGFEAALMSAVSSILSANEQHTIN